MRDHVRNSLRHVVATLVAIALGLIACALLSGCKTTEVVREVPVVTEHTTIQHHTDIVRDTLLMRDSVYHYVQGDTVIIERWHHVANVSKMIITDTIHDTVPKVVTTTKVITKTEARAVQWWQVAAVLAAFGIVVYICKRR